MKNTLASTLLFVANAAAQTVTSTTSPTPAPTQSDGGYNNQVVSGATIAGFIVIMAAMFIAENKRQQRERERQEARAAQGNVPADVDNDLPPYSPRTSDFIRTPAGSPSPSPEIPEGPSPVYSSAETQL